MQESIPSLRVGFDRFVDLEWANLALRLSLQDGSDDEKVRQLDNLLADRIAGAVSARKTTNLLTRLWLKPVAEWEHTDEVRNIFSNGMSGTEFAFLHHGRALVIFPFYKFVSKMIGRLGNIQPSFVSKDLQSRVLEKYGDLSSVHRSIDRVLQTQVNWGLLHREGKEFIIGPQEIFISGGYEWLVKCALLSIPEKRCSISDLLILPELLGYSITRERIQSSSAIRMERDGAAREVVYLG